MTSWNDALTDAPDLARLVQARIEATGLAFLATLRKDGSPRISGVEPMFADGELWLGMMPGSMKARDLQRDPRLALHNASVDKEVTDGDVKVGGRGVEITDEAEVDRIRDRFAEAQGHPPPPGPMHLFRVDVTELSSLLPADDHLAMSWWTPGQPVTHHDRY